MDTVTQMLLGATVAQAGFRRRLGRRAMVAGAAVALVPDLDVVVGWAGDTFDVWAWHRVPTHSILFGLVFGGVFGGLIWLWRRGRAPGPDETARSWVYLAVLALLTHVLIDLPTSYGTVALWPLTDFRFAWDGLGIIDVVYSLALVVALVVGVVVKKRPRLAQDVAFAALLFVGAWTMGGMAINGLTEAQVRAEVGPGAQVDAYPTLFQPFYRRVVVQTPDAVLVGYRSILGGTPSEWRSFPRQNDPAIDMVRRTKEGNLLSWFAMNEVYWTATPTGDGATRVRGYDLRYGMAGESTLGFWGIQADVRNGRVDGPVTDFRQRPSADVAGVLSFLATALGRDGW